MLFLKHLLQKEALLTPQYGLNALNQYLETQIEELSPDEIIGHRKNVPETLEMLWTAIDRCKKTQKNLIESLRKRELGYTASFSRLHLNSLESFKKQLLFPSFPKPKTAKELIHFKNLINKRMAGLNDWFESKYLTTEARRYEIREAVLHHMTILARLDMINLAV